MPDSPIDNDPIALLMAATYEPKHAIRNSVLYLECVCKIAFICHSEKRSDEESQITEQIFIQNRDSSLLTVAQNDIPLICIQTCIQTLRPVPAAEEVFVAVSE